MLFLVTVNAEGGLGGQVQGNNSILVENVAFHDLTTNSVTVEWETSAPSYTRLWLLYKKQPETWVPHEPAGLSTSHSIILTELEPGTNYTVRVFAKNSSCDGEVELHSFVTLKETPVVIEPPETSGNETQENETQPGLNETVNETVGGEAVDLDEEKENASQAPFGLELPGVIKDNWNIFLILGVGIIFFLVFLPTVYLVSSFLKKARQKKQAEELPFTKKEKELRDKKTELKEKIKTLDEKNKLTKKEKKEKKDYEKELSKVLDDFMEEASVTKDTKLEARAEKALQELKEGKSTKKIKQELQNEGYSKKELEKIMDAMEKKLFKNMG
jgi:hypothetical protein